MFLLHIQESASNHMTWNSPCYYLMNKWLKQLPNSIITELYKTKNKKWEKV